MTDSPLGQICLQVHRPLAPAFDAAALAADAEAIARRTAGVRGFGMDEVADEGGYVNLVFACESPADAWPALREALFALAGTGAWLPAASICVATGDHGWDDPVVLHHHDPSVTLGPVTGDGDAGDGDAVAGDAGDGDEAGEADTGEAGDDVDATGGAEGRGDAVGGSGDAAGDAGVTSPLRRVPAPGKP